MPNVSLWLSEPDVPVRMAVCEIAGALLVAKNAMVSGVPGLKVIVGDATETPAERFVTCTVTEDEKPFKAVTDSDIGVEPPEGIDIEVGLTVIVKSGGDGGGGGGF